MSTSTDPEFVSPESELVTLTLLTTARHLSRDARLDALLDTAIEHGANLAAAAGADCDQIAAALVGYDQAAEPQTIVRPPVDVLEATPTVADVQRWPAFYINGPGRALASSTECTHGYKLTSSCPGCDHDAERAGNEPDPDHGVDIIRDRENGL